MPVKKTATKGHTTKHAKTKTKHEKTSKHTPAKTAKKATAHKATVHTKAKAATHAKATALALAPGDVACCAAEALAADLRLQDYAVSDAEMLDLFWRAGGHPDKGLPIAEMLEAVSELGLAGVRPVRFEPVDLADPWRLLDEGLRSIILGLELPGPHAVCDDGHWWWSWGEPYPVTAFPDAVVEEAWAVTWAVTA